MKNLIIIFTLLFPILSHAKWVTLEISPNAFILVDDSSVKKSNGYVYYWMLVNYIRPGDLMSLRGFMQLDCKTPRKQRMLSWYAYEENMAKGSPYLTQTNPGEWEYMQSNSNKVNDNVAKKVCDKNLSFID
jgi:hypothetical protein